MEVPIHPASPPGTTYPSTTAWPPWTGTSSPPGGSLCPDRVQWGAPSPQSAVAALWRGHTTVTGSTQLDTTKDKHTDTCHLHSSPSTGIVAGQHYDHPSRKPASGLSYLTCVITRVASTSTAPAQTRDTPVPSTSGVKSGTSLCTVPLSGSYLD